MLLLGAAQLDLLVVGRELVPLTVVGETCRTLLLLLLQLLLLYQIFLRALLRSQLHIIEHLVVAVVGASGQLRA